MILTSCLWSTDIISDKVSVRALFLQCSQKIFKMFRFVLIAALIALSSANVHRNCASNKPAVRGVRIAGCDATPCPVVKGKNAEVEIDFTPDHDVAALNAKVMATAIGVTVPYPLPEAQGNVCKNLKDGASCPLDADEDVTYKFIFPVATYYPEIPVSLEITIVDGADTPVACFSTEIKVQKA